MPKRQDHKLKSFRISPEADRLLNAMAIKLGIAQTAVLELALRRMSQDVDVAIESPETLTRSGAPPNPDQTARK